MKIMKRILVLLLAILMAATLLAGCGSTSKSDDSSSDGGAIVAQGKDTNVDPVKIAVIPLSQLGSLNIPINKAFEEKLSEFPNITIDQLEAKYDPTTQISLINEAVAQGYDAIILECTDHRGCFQRRHCGGRGRHPRHHERRQLPGCPYSPCTVLGLYGGQSAAENVAALLNNEGNVVILNGDAAQANVRVMGAGFEDYMKENTNIQVLDHQYVPQWSQENANTTMRDLLTKYDDIDGVYVCNDDMAVGAIQAIKATGRDNDGIVVWGYVGTEAGLSAIKDGDMAGTNYLDTYSLTIAQLNVALYCISNGLNVKTLGLKETPIITMSCPVINADNIDTYLAINRYGSNACPKYSIRHNISAG
jgi:ribose transport system substrate-binding protein